MIIQESDILHYGKKGMKWGVRKAKDNSTTKKSGPSTKKKAAMAVGSVAALTVGAVVINRVLKSSGQKKLAAAETARVAQIAARSDAYKHTIAGIKSVTLVKLRKIAEASDAGRITPGQGSRLVSLLSRDSSNALKRAASSYSRSLIG